MLGLGMTSLNLGKEGINRDDLRIIFYLTGFLLLQISFNVPFYFFSLLPNSTYFASEYNIFNWTITYSGDFILPILVTVFFQLFVNFFLVKFWNSKQILSPSRKHWILSYTIFILIIVLVTVLFSVFTLGFRDLLFWPWIGVLLPSLGLYGFLYGFSFTFQIIFALIFFPVGDYILHAIIFVIIVTFTLSSPILFLYPGFTIYYFFRLIEKDRVNIFFLLTVTLFWLIFQLFLLFFILNVRTETF